MTKQKNHTLLIDLFSYYKKINKNYNLYILGEGEEEKFLQEKILKLKLEDRVFLLGFKKNIYPYIMLSRAVISPSLWEDPGAVMIEAAFCNKIVLSSDCKNGPKEFLMNSKAGYLFENDNLDSLIKSFNELIEDAPEEIYKKKVLAKINSKKYTIFNHYLILKNLLMWKKFWYQAVDVYIFFLVDKLIKFVLLKSSCPIIFWKFVWVSAI